MTRPRSGSARRHPHSKGPPKPINGHDLLQAVASLPLSTWRYDWEPPHVRHLGPTAQDWQTVIGLSSDGRTIPLVDANGVLLTAVQALLHRVRELESRVDRLQTSITDQPAAHNACRCGHPGNCRAGRIVSG